MRLPARRLALAFAAAHAVVLAALPAAAQADAMAHPQMFVVHVERVMPSKVAEYEATSKEFLAAVSAHRTAIPLLSMTALQGEDLAYSYIAPIRSMADVDAINAQFDALGKAVGESWGPLMEKNGQTIASVDDGAFVEVPGASYWPAGAAVTPANAAYYQLDFYRVMPGKEAAAGEVAMQWKALFEKAKVPYGYSVFRLAFGSDGPLWVVSTPARDAADLAAIQSASMKGIGQAAWNAQMARTMAIARGFDSKRYWVRRDLSLAPAAMGK